MNFIKLEKITGFILSLIILASIGLLVSGVKFEVKPFFLLFTYLIAAINIVLSTYNRGGKANRTISIILSAVLIAGLGLGLIAFI